MKLIKCLGRRLSKTGNSSTAWGLFKCDFCFREVERSYKSKETKSCGCSHGLLRHGEKKNHTKLYYVWKEMRWRCHHSQNKSYKYYGGRGVHVCDEWRYDYSNFRRWALINGYKEGLTIDRIDNYSGYHPNNCRWVTQSVNNKNKRIHQDSMENKSKEDK